MASSSWAAAGRGPLRAVRPEKNQLGMSSVKPFFKQCKICLQRTAIFIFNHCNKLIVPKTAARNWTNKSVCLAKSAQLRCCSPRGSAEVCCCGISISRRRRSTLLIHRGRGGHFTHTRTRGAHRITKRRKEVRESASVIPRYSNSTLY